MWLLDDEKAIRDALQLTSDHNIPNVAKTKDPKEMLSAIIADAPAEFADVSAALGAIAEQLNPQRCVHRKATGLATFIEDVDGEVRPVVCS